jgi:hypothetical protein
LICRNACQMEPCLSQAREVGGDQLTPLLADLAF